MASALADSYTKVVGSPINAGGSFRPGGDNISISYTSGKKSTQEQLDELAIQKAKDDLARLALLPVSSEQERYQWEAENQRLAEEAAAREAEAAALDIQRGQLALLESKATLPLTIATGQTALKEARATLPLTIASEQAGLKTSQAALEAQQLATQQARITNPLDIQAKEQEISKAKIQTPIQTETMKAGLAATNQAMQLAALDAFYKEQEYKDAHWGATPAQVDAARYNVNYRQANSPGPVGSQANTAFMKSVYGMDLAKGIGYNQHGEPYVVKQGTYIPPSTNSRSFTSDLEAAAGKSPWR